MERNLKGGLLAKGGGPPIGRVQVFPVGMDPPPLDASPPRQGRQLAEGQKMAVVSFFSSLDRLRQPPGPTPPASESGHIAPWPTPPANTHARLLPLRILLPACRCGKKM